MTIIWNDNLKTGIEVLDNQHQLLFETINKLDDAKKDKFTFYEILSKLRVYIREHFNTEENFMNSSDYPGYAHHRAVHDDFVVYYKEFFRKLAMSGNALDLAPEFILFVEKWLSFFIRMSNESKPALLFNFFYIFRW